MPQIVLAKTQHSVEKASIMKTWWWHGDGRYYANIRIWMDRCTLCNNNKVIGARGGGENNNNNNAPIPEKCATKRTRDKPGSAADPGFRGGGGVARDGAK